jgi:hypothetical protein
MSPGRRRGMHVAILMACEVHKGGTVPSPLFNFLFVAALFVPAIMYIGGVIILMVSLVLKHYRTTHDAASHSVEALAH